MSLVCLFVVYFGWVFSSNNIKILQNKKKGLSLVSCGKQDLMHNLHLSHLSNCSPNQSINRVNLFNWVIWFVLFFIYLFFFKVNG